ASMVFPTIVAVFGVVAVHGRAGLLARAAQALGVGPPTYLYGLAGILLAHAFFNAPLAARLYLNALEATPAAQWRVAASLGFRPRDVFRLIDRPALRRATPAAAGLIFMLCATSFAPVLALGGGPGAATLEVAIYEALRFEFDLPRAATLAIAQIALATSALALGAAARGPRLGAHEATRPAARIDRDAVSTRIFDAAAFALAGAAILSPVVGAAASGFEAAFAATLSDPSFARALLTSLAIAAPSGLAATAAAWALAAAATRLDVRLGRPRLAAAIGATSSLILAAPPFALATGLFILLRPHVAPANAALPLVIVTNALAALPFALRAIGPALAAGAERHDRLARSLGVEGLARLRLIDWPTIRRPVGLALATATAMSLGDLGVAALFGQSATMTLPVLLYAYLGAYQMDRAAATMLALMALIVGLFLIIERIVGGRA
ncbi:MAG: thiamine/thiamine pyrophosphate ABC transporter permease ThiP, partial [Methylobacteriaceae bacterium]|nr:thiamine/thiamine pyrophosphate ABC transporter permease ThiP [Methylobacteriaceae bacterium]